jgi:Domain of unknown function (DUF4129)
MSAKSFDKTSFGWQIQQLQQRAGEWLEVKFRPALSKAVNSLGFPEWLWDILVAIGWAILFFVVAWLGLQIYRQLRPYIESLIFPIRDRQKSTLLEDKSAAYTVAEWLQQAQKWRSQGNYSEACRALYMALLQRLSDAELIPAQASRTDREYLKLMAKIPSCQSCKLLVATHEQIWFGNASISSETFERCQKAYQDVDDRLRSLQSLQPRGAS